MEIGTWIKEERAARRVSLRELASQADMSFQRLWQIEQGSNNPTLDTADKIVTALGSKLWKVLKVIDP